MVSAKLYPCIFCVSLLMDLFVLCVASLTVFVNGLVKEFAIFKCGCYFVIECYGCVECGWSCSVGYTVYCLPKNVCVSLGAVIVLHTYIEHQNYLHMSILVMYS